MSRLFRPTVGKGDFHLNAIVDHFHEDDYTLAQGFAGAGEKLIEQWVTTRRADDSLLVPIIWLYRHGMELAMKQAIRDASQCVRRNGNSDPKLSPEAIGLWFRTRVKHDLDGLAHRLDELLQELDLDSLPADVHEVLAEIHAMDPSGDNFRYSEQWDRVNKVVRKTIRPESYHVDIRRLGNELQSAFNVIYFGASAVLEVYLEFQSEMESEMAQYEPDIDDW